LLASSVFGAGELLDDHRGHVGVRGLIARWTKLGGELRETVPIGRRRGQLERAVLSRPLPTVKRGDHIRISAEVTVTTTCMVSSPRCIGRRYRFDPRIRAEIVIAKQPRAAGGGTLPIARSTSLSCGQRRPNRNHHCPLVISGSFAVHRPERLPCPLAECRLNFIVDAHNRSAKGGEVVVIGGDRPNGHVKGGKARLNAAILRNRADITEATRTTTRERVRRLPTRSRRVVYSVRMGHLEAGDVLLVRAKQRTAVKRRPYFVGSNVVVTTAPRATRATPLARRIVSPRAMAADQNGFNCTLGPSAFRSPCLTIKAGLARIERAPRQGGRRRPLFVNLVSGGFPKVSQAKLASYPPLRVLQGGNLTVTRLRVAGLR
jgi:hypothetical protein